MSEIGICEIKHRLLDEFTEAIREVILLLSHQSTAVITGDPEFPRYDLLLQLAQERKDAAKYAFIAHVEAHHCESQ